MHKIICIFSETSLDINIYLNYLTIGLKPVIDLGSNTYTAFAYFELTHRYQQVGNYYWNYTGNDSNHDYIGDTPYKIYDTYDDDSLGHVNRTSIAMGGSQFEVIASDPHRTTNYYLPTRLRVALGTKFDNNTWRLELYRLGRMRRGSGVGATNGYGYRSGGPRSHGLRTVVPRYVVPANSDGSFHLSDMLDTTSENGTYIMRLRDTSTNTVTQFAIQKLRFRRININSKSGGGSLGTIAACYLTF